MREKQIIFNGFVESFCRSRREGNSKMPESERWNSVTRCARCVHYRRYKVMFDSMHFRAPPRNFGSCVKNLAYVSGNMKGCESWSTADDLWMQYSVDYPLFSREKGGVPSQS
jgi:hypothetical protein